MTKILFLMLVGTLAAFTIAEKNETFVPPEPPKPQPSPEPPKPPTPTTTTTVPTIPTKSTTTTKPTTPPSTTTPSSTTTTTTTPEPEPTPSPKPAPAPKPVDPSIGVWQLNYTNSNTSFLMVQFALQIEVPYNTTFNKSQSAYIDVPKNAAATGDYNNETQSITLQWSVGANVFDQITLNFTTDNTTKKYKLEDIEISITPTNESFPDWNNKDVLHLNHKRPEFGTTVSKSYRCAKQQELNLTDVATQKLVGYIHVSHLQFEAFHNITNKEFSSAEDCAPFDTPDVVPIAVGCALAALVIIVLVAYLIGRRRRQARGYLSMFTETKRESDYIPMKNLSCFQ